MATLRRKSVLFVLLIFVMLRESGSTVVGQTGFPFTFTDDLGRSVTLTAPAGRIVSLVPSYSQALFAIGAGDTLVGVTRFDNYPPELVRIVNEGRIVVVGGGFDPDFEKVVALRPDVVLGDGPSHRTAIKKLEELGLQVIYLNPEKMADVINRIILLGRITGRDSGAGRLAQGMNQRIINILAKVQATPIRPRVYVEVWNDPLISVGPGTLSDELVNSAGGANIFADSSVKFPIVSSETLIKRDPEVIILVHTGSVDEVKRRPGWNLVSAVKNNRIFEIIPRLFSPGPSIVDGLEAVALAIHPDLIRSVTLAIMTNPRITGIHIYVDGQLSKTSNDGSLSMILVTGSHAVLLVNTTVTQANKRQTFSSWSGAASGSANPLNLQLLTNSTLVINYSQCIIATVSYGSELADEVQLLRGFRDHAVLSTKAGRNFMKAFDSWYYSFSPAVAESISQNEFLKGITRALLYPLIGILRLAYYTYNFTAGDPELRVVSAGALASVLIAIVYLVPVELLLSRTRGFGVLFRSRILVGAFALAFSSLASILLSLSHVIAIDLTLTTPVFVISLIVGSSLLTSWLILWAKARVASFLQKTTVL